MKEIVTQKMRYLMLCFFWLILSGCADIDKISLGKGYLLSWPSRDHTRIVKNGKTVIEETIVSYDTTRKYIVGLRLKTLPVICPNGANTMVSSQKIYFILNKDNGRVYQYYSHKAFNDRLRDFDIHEDISLDYAKFDIVWDYYSASYIHPKDTYWRFCKPQAEIRDIE